MGPRRAVSRAFAASARTPNGYLLRIFSGKTLLKAEHPGLAVAHPEGESVGIGRDDFVAVGVGYARVAAGQADHLLILNSRHYRQEPAVGVDDVVLEVRVDRISASEVDVDSRSPSERTEHARREDLRAYVHGSPGGIIPNRVSCSVVRQETPQGHCLRIVHVEERMSRRFVHYHHLAAHEAKAGRQRPGQAPVELTRRHVAEQFVLAGHGLEGDGALGLVAAEGEAGQVAGEACIKRPTEKGRRFIVSAKSEEELIRGMRSGALWLTIGACVFAIAGLVTLVMALVRK